MSLLPKTVKRIQKELLEFDKAKHTTLFLCTVEEKCDHLQALIIGPEDTPFEHGFFFFDIHPPNTYPMDPPKVTFLTPNTNNCRLHPNLYSTGKVCLSILGTWSGPSWVATYGFEKVLFTIQSLLDNNAIAHEPSYEKCKPEQNDSINYSACSRWLTLDASVDLFKSDLPESFRLVMKEYYLKNFDKYVQSVEKLRKYDGKEVI